MLQLSAPPRAARIAPRSSRGLQSHRSASAQHRPPLRTAGSRQKGERPSPPAALRGSQPAAKMAVRRQHNARLGPQPHRPAGGERPRRRRVVPREKGNERNERNRETRGGRAEPSRSPGGGNRTGPARPRDAEKGADAAAIPAAGTCVARRFVPGGSGRGGAALREDSGAAAAAGAGLRTADAPRSPHCLPLAPTAI